jgi:hypothetical protein
MNDETPFDYSLDWTEMAEEWAKEARKQYESVALVMVYAFLGAAIPVVIAILAWPAIALWFYPSVVEMVQSTTGRIIGLLSLGVLGAVLYLVREHFRRFYGVAEVAIGLVGCWAGLLKSASDSLLAVVAIASGVYVIVRGIDNFVQGRTFVGVLAAHLRDKVKARAEQKYKAT